MKTYLFTLALVILLHVSPASGQERQPRIGVGVSLNPTALFVGPGSTLFLPVGFTNIYVPIEVSPTFRLEPEVGIFSASSGSSTTTYFRGGVGLLYVRSIDSSFNIYVGPRIGALSTSSTGSTGVIDFFLGPCVGGEQSFSPHFSIGGEAQLNYVRFGRPRNGSIITNNALMFFRWYF